MQKRPLTLEDLLAIAVPQDPQMAPDGTRVAFTVRTVNRDTRRTVTHLHVGAPGEAARQLTAGPFRDTAPRWSPDGRRLAFLTTRPHPELPAGRECTQLAVMAVDGGEPTVLTREDAALADPAWTPDGRLVFAMRRHDPVMEGEKTPAAIRVTRLTYKANGIGYLPQDRWHLYVVDPRDAGAPRPLTSGDWDDTHPVVSPDGRWLAWISNRRAERELDPENHDVWVMELAGGEPRVLSTLRGELHTPVFAPDGRTVVFLQAPGPRGNFLLDNTHVFAVPVDGSAPERDLTPDLDRCALNLTMSDSIGIEQLASPPAFTAGGGVVFQISDSGRTLLAEVPLAGGSIRRWPGGATVAAVHQARPGGPLALLVTDHADPGTVAVAEVGGGPSRLVHDPNAHWRAEVALSEPEELWVTPPGGVPIQAWLLRPDGPGPHPLLLYIHGGPVFQYGHGFFHELQLLRARGFAVLYGNPRGSQGYGRDFAWSIQHDWGTLPTIDLMALVDEVLARGGLDPARLGVLGGSYGGYLTLWIIAHSERFRAACTQRPVSHIEAMIWSDFGGHLGDWIGSFPWEDPDLYRRMSPLTYADRMNTPLLITQGLDDQRTPADQGERAFVTLKRLGKTVEMVLFPGADHELSRKGRPEQRLARLDAIAGWMERYLLSSGQRV